MKIDIWSDVVCPWCYIGKRRFENALTHFAHKDDVEFTWRSFELDPTAPPSPESAGDYTQHLAGKYGLSVAEAETMIERVTSVAAEEGLSYRFDLARRGNTFDAHRLLHLGLARGVQNDLKEKLDHATFSEGLPVSDHEALARVAQQVGIDAAEAREMLASDTYTDAVRADQAQARAYGISAVPFFVIDNKYGMAGAQSSDVILTALEQAWEEQSSPTPSTSSL